MIIVLAGHDALRLPRIWSEVRVRDGLECYVRTLQDRALEEFKHQQVLFVNGGMKKAPKPPQILKWMGRTGKKREIRSPVHGAPERPAFLDALEREE